MKATQLRASGTLLQKHQGDIVKEVVQRGDAMNGFTKAVLGSYAYAPELHSTHFA